MKRSAFVLSVLALVVGLLVFGGYMYFSWGRKLIYPEGTTSTLYPGIGEQSVQYGVGRIYVNPRKEGAPFYDDSWKRFLYPDSTYEVIEMVEKAKLNAVVGRMSGWEEIGNSPDKYLLLELADHSIQKYRIAFAPSTIYSEGDVESSTILAVEDIGMHIGVSKQNPIRQVVGQYTSSVGYDRLKRVIRNGDAVVVVPIMKPPYYATKDETGNIIAMSIVLRRIGGVDGLEAEMKLGGW